jgi:hypothetical protein
MSRHCWWEDVNESSLLMRTVWDDVNESSLIENSPPSQSSRPFYLRYCFHWGSRPEQISIGEMKCIDQIYIGDQYRWPPPPHVLRGASLRGFFLLISFINDKQSLLMNTNCHRWIQDVTDDEDKQSLLMKTSHRWWWEPTKLILVDDESLQS